MKFATLSRDLHRCNALLVEEMGWLLVAARNPGHVMLE
jgi:hypothetical protein